MVSKSDLVKARAVRNRGAKKNLVSTGASDGIGKALAWEMAKRGYNLGLTSRRLPLLTELKDDISALYPHINIVVEPLDVTNSGQVSEVLNRIHDLFGTIDIVVVNAGIAKSGRVGIMSVEEQIGVIGTNLSGAIATVSTALKLFRQQGYGHIVATSSVAGSRGLPRNAAYSASKAGLSTFMESVRLETRNDNIDVTVINPGFIESISTNQNSFPMPFIK